MPGGQTLKMPWVSVLPSPPPPPLQEDGGWRCWSLFLLLDPHNPKAPVGPSSVTWTGLVNRQTWSQDNVAKGREKEPLPSSPSCHFTSLFLSSWLATHFLVFLCSLLTTITTIIDIEEVLCSLRFTETDSSAGQT